MELSGPVVKQYRQEWYKNPTLPLEIMRSRYDDDVHSWEVDARQSPTSWAPIAEFSTWRQAWDWAIIQAQYARQVQEIEVIRYGGFDENGERIEESRA